MTFAQTALIHELATEATGHRWTVSCPPAQRFSAEVEKMRRTVDDFDGDELLGAFIRRCRRLLRDVSLAPLPPSDQALGLEDSVEFLMKLAEQADGSYPTDVVDHAWACATALHDLARDGNNPLGDAIAELLSDAPGGLIGVITKSRHFEQIKRWSELTFPSVFLLTASNLRQFVRLERLAIVGPSCWFPAHIFSAPRAETIWYVHHEFYRDRQPESAIFATSQWSSPIQIPSPSAPHQERGAGEVDANSLVPTVDWDALAKDYGAVKRSVHAEVESVPAILYLLADGYSVYLESTDGPKIDVVCDLALGGQPRLRSLEARAVQAEDYIVLRSEGRSGHYIPEIADARLGATRAAQLRAIQTEWKAALRDKVRQCGFGEVERDLKRLGVRSPHLQYRLWKNSLRSRDPNDFRILMRYIGLAERAEEIWMAMDQLFDAHLGAGQDVRRLLEQAVVASDTERLLECGRIDVRLPDVDAGALTVFRVEWRAPEPVIVDEDALRIPKKVDADLWPG